MKLIIDKNHPVLTSTQDIETICQPLFDRFGIDYLNYSCVYNDATHIALTNHAGQIYDFYEKDYKSRFLYSSKMPQYIGKHSFILWSEFPTNQLLRTIEEHHNINHGITIAKNYENMTEYFSFATTCNNTNVVNFCLENFDVIELFIQYFKDKAKTLIKKSERNRIILPADINDDLVFDDSYEKNYINDKVAFIKQLGLKRYLIKSNNISFSVTRKELQCLNLLAMGFSAKKIAKELGVSPRTVQQRMVILRMKSNCSKITSLVNIYTSSDNYKILKYILP